MKKANPKKASDTLQMFPHCLNVGNIIGAAPTIRIQHKKVVWKLTRGVSDLPAGAAIVGKHTYSGRRSRSEPAFLVCVWNRSRHLNMSPVPPDKGKKYFSFQYLTSI